MKLTNLHELRLAKMQAIHEIELREHSIGTGMQALKGSLVEELKASLRTYTKELITHVIMKLIVHGKRREQ